MMYDFNEFPTYWLETEDNDDFYNPPYGNKNFDQYCFINTISGFCKLSDGYIEIARETTDPIYVHAAYLMEIMMTTNIKKLGVNNYTFGPAIRRENLGRHRSDDSNIIGTKSVWVNIGNLNNDTPFHQQLKEAKTLLSNFKLNLQKYNIVPHFIVSNAYGFSVFFVFDNIFEPPFTDWSMIQNALTVMAKGNIEKNGIAGMVHVPGSYLYDNGRMKKIKIVNDAYYRTKNYIGDVNNYYLSDFKDIVRDYR